MSLDISGSKFVTVYDPSIKLNFSDKVVVASLVTSRKTGNPKVDKKTGEVVTNPDTGKEVQERAHSRWEGRFMGNAFEASKGLQNGDCIDIISGWVTHEPRPGKDGVKYYMPVANITDFTPSNVAEGEDINPADEE